MRFSRLAALAASAALVAAPPLQADALADAAAAAEAGLAAGDGAAAVAAGRAFLDAVWQQAGFGVSYVALVEPGPSGYGLHIPRGDASYAEGEPVLIYFEAYGYGYGTPEPGLHRIAMQVDLEMIDASGQTVARLRDLTSLEHVSRRPAKEFSAQLRYNLSAPPGRYVLVTTLRDAHSDGAASFRTEVELGG